MKHLCILSFGRFLNKNTITVKYGLNCKCGMSGSEKAIFII